MNAAIAGMGFGGTPHSRCPLERAVIGRYVHYLFHHARTDMRKAIKAALFASAFSPALISVGIARMLSSGLSWDATYYIAVGLLGCLSIVYILQALKWHGESFSFQVKKIEPNDAVLLGIVLTYLLPFFSKASDITATLMISIFLLGMIFFWFTDSILPSPLMRLMNFRFYKIESASGVVYTLVSNRDILDPKDIKSVKKISNYMLLEVVE